MIRKYTEENPAPAFQVCGLDSLYLSLGAVRFNPAFDQLRRQLPGIGQRRQDCRPLGLPLILHNPDKPKWGKIQFTNIGKMDLTAIIQTLNCVIEGSPN